MTLNDTDSIGDSKEKKHKSLQHLCAVFWPQKQCTFGEVFSTAAAVFHNCSLRVHTRTTHKRCVRQPYGGAKFIVQRIDKLGWIYRNNTRRNRQTRLKHVKQVSPRSTCLLAHISKYKMTEVKVCEPCCTLTSEVMHVTSLN